MTSQSPAAQKLTQVLAALRQAKVKADKLRRAEDAARRRAGLKSAANNNA